MARHVLVDNLDSNNKTDKENKMVVFCTICRIHPEVIAYIGSDTITVKCPKCNKVIIVAEVSVWTQPTFKPNKEGVVK